MILKSDTVGLQSLKGVQYRFDEQPRVLLTYPSKFAIVGPTSDAQRARSAPPFLAL